MENQSIFQRIFLGEIEGVILCSSEKWFAILTNRATMPGHCLIIPKRLAPTYIDLNEQEMKEFGIVSHLLHHGLLETYHTQKIGAFVSGFEVPHYHHHLIPVNAAEELQVTETYPVSIEERREEGAKIKKVLKEILGDTRSYMGIQITIHE